MIAQNYLLGAPLLGRDFDFNIIQSFIYENDMGQEDH